MRIIKTFLKLVLFFRNDQLNPNKINPIKRYVFSLKLRLVRFLKKKQYKQAMEIKNNGTIFEVIKMKIDLYIFELNKYLIPKILFRVNIEDICRG